MSKHTRGPWIVWNVDEMYKIDKADHLRTDRENDSIEIEANARLIAVAPEMLEFIKITADMLGDRYIADQDKIHIKALTEKAIQLIRKAEGKG